MRYLLIIPAVALFASCTTQKHIITEHIVADSTVTRVRDSASAVIEQLEVKHKHELDEAKNTGIIFDTVYNIPDSMFQRLFETGNCDSTALVHLEQTVKSLQNKVKINADGSIEAQGRIKAAYSNVKKLESELDEVTSEKATLKQQVDSLRVELQKKVDTKVRDVDRHWFTGLVWWGILIAFVAGYLLRGKFDIFALFKKTTHEKSG